LIQDFRTGPGKTLRLSQDEIVLQFRAENVIEQIQILAIKARL
jgi:hypothetical protein